MANQKRAAKRSTKAAKRRPTTKRKSRRKATTARPTGAAAKGEGGAFQSGAFQGLPPSASQRKLSPAVQATQGVIEPSPAALSLSTTPPEVRLQGVGSVQADAIVIPAPVPITPTVYPESPLGTIIVQNYVTINIQREEFSRFNKNIEALIGELRLSNEISGEVRDQLLSELRAGREIITAPKPQRDLIDLLLVKPLKWLAEKSGSAIISKLAEIALELLLKMLI